jgi:rod shape-determining protein MreC
MYSSDTLPHKNYNTIPVLIIATIVSGIFYALGTLGITDPIAKGILFSLAPVLQGLNKIQVEVNNEFSTLTEMRSIAKKYKATSEQNLELRAEVARLEKIADENNKLREQLGAPQLDKFKLTPAEVISKDRLLTVVYDQNNLVTKNSIAVFKNHFVGKIDEASNRSATILLATDPEMNIPVDIISQDGKVVKAVLIGEFGTGMNVTRIDQDAKIQKGDTVVVSKTPGLPEGVVVGEIREVKKRESELFQTAKVSSFIQFETLKTVFIIQ